jgi:hypothetical protein
VWEIIESGTAEGACQNKFAEPATRRDVSMTPYEEFVAASEEWMRLQNEARLVLEGVVAGFLQFCQIPVDRIRFMPWDEKLKVFTANQNQILPLSHSVGFNNQSDEWDVGLSISNSNRGEAPRANVAFPIIVKAADNHKFMVSFGDQTPQLADLNLTSWREAFLRGEKWSLTLSCSVTRHHEDGKIAMSRRTLSRMSANEILSLIDAEIAALQQARAALAGTAAKKKPGRPKSTAAPVLKTKKKRRTLSAEARAKIADAQRKRWAAVRKAAK